MAVFVLDRAKNPLMPCTEKRARLLLQRGRARVVRLHPFTIRLVDRSQADSTLQPVRLKLDPGSKTTGLAVLREGPESSTALHLAEIHHRGRKIRDALLARRALRRGRRARHTRYRAPRFLNRTRAPGWLAPSLQHRVDTVSAWVRRYRALAPITALSVETVRFDLQKQENPEIAGIEYQQGTLFGYEVREYLLEKWGRRCAYCRAENTPLQVEHLVPRARGGSHRVSNLTIACQPCNQDKGNRTAEEYGHPHLMQQAQRPLGDAAAVNTTRWALYRVLSAMGMPIEIGSGGRTKFNRTRLGLPKTHALDALSVGTSTPEQIQRLRQSTLAITCKGRGRYARTLPDRFGFPRAFLMRQKSVHGFQTGDLVSASVPTGKYVGRYPLAEVRVRASGSFDLFGPSGKLAQGIRHTHCRRRQRFDGYTYALSPQKNGVPSPPLRKGFHAGLSMIHARRAAFLDMLQTGPLLEPSPAEAVLAAAAHPLAAAYRSVRRFYDGLSWRGHYLTSRLYAARDAGVIAEVFAPNLTIHWAPGVLPVFATHPAGKRWIEYVRQAAAAGVPPQTDPRGHLGHWELVATDPAVLAHLRDALRSRDLPFRPVDDGVCLRALDLPRWERIRAAAEEVYGAWILPAYTPPTPVDPAHPTLPAAPAAATGPPQRPSGPDRAKAEPEMELSLF